MTTALREVPVALPRLTPETVLTQPQGSSGPDRENLNPMCPVHHDERHSIGVRWPVSGWIEYEEIPGHPSWVRCPRCQKHVRSLRMGRAAHAAWHLKKDREAAELQEIVSRSAAQRAAHEKGIA